MGSLIGGVVGGIGSLIGGSQAASAEKNAAKTALTGYNYLSTNPLLNQVQTSAAGNVASENTQASNQAATTNDINQLLTSNGTDNPAFKNYLNSTGYNFQLQQGTNAITGNAAAKGLLNSGATAKALTTYGQNLASTTFNNYLSQLGANAGQQGAAAQTQMALTNQGINAAEDIGAAGSIGGANAAQMQAQAGQSTGSSIANAFNTVGGGLASTINNGNFFSKPASTPSSLAGLI